MPERCVRNLYASEEYSVRNVLRVALYVRKSRADIEQEKKAAERGESYDTLKRHRNELLRLAKKRGYTIIEIYEEVVSGDTIEARPEMQRLLKDVKDFVYDAILVIDYDRLGRGNKEDQGRIEQVLKDTDTLIITPSEIIDLNSEQGEFTADTKGFIARMEYRISAKRFKEGKKRSISEGKDVANRQPYGYSKDKETKKLYPNEYAPFAKLIFELYDEIGTLHGVCEELYKMGITTAKGKDRWNYQTIKRMLKNKKYIGTMFFYANKKRDYVEEPNAHTAIVDEELFYRVNKKLLEVNDHKTNKKYALQNPFASISHCEICDSVMKLHNLTYKYMRCSNYHCTNKFIRFEEFEEKFLSKLESTLKRIEVNSEEIEIKDNKVDTLVKQLDLLYEQENKLKKREKNIYISYEEEIYTKEQFKERLNELNADKTDLKEKIETLLEIIEYEKSQLDRVSNIAPTIRNVLDVYHLSNPEQKNRLLRSFVKDIIVHKPFKFKDFKMEIILKD
jgi:DNA invertase Pin-like site-specific DNA recombinase